MSASDHSRDPLTIEKTLVALLSRANARKRVRDKIRLKALTLAAMSRWGGRTLPLGIDRLGRQYIVFSADPLSVYVQPSMALVQPGDEESVWKVYRGNEAVAALALALSPRVPRERWLQLALVRHFPEAVSVLRDSEFPQRLADWASTPSSSCSTSSSSSNSDVSKGKRQLRQQQKPSRESLRLGSSNGKTFGIGDAVWVCKKRSRGVDGEGMEGDDSVFEERWKAVVKEVRTGGGDSTATSSTFGKGAVWCMVSFEGWGRKFDRWESADALTVRHDGEEEGATVADVGENKVGPGLPTEGDELHQRKVMEGLEANWYMDKPGRARGLRCSFPSFTQAETESSALAKTKAMILTIQAALPTGARLRARGRFDGSLLQSWITHVEEATTAVQLMEAWLLLETSINPRWLETSYMRLFSILPSITLALETATFPSVCLRAWVMDRCLQYSRYNAAAEDVGMSEIAISMLPQHIASRRKKGQAYMDNTIEGELKGDDEGELNMTSSSSSTRGGNSTPSSSGKGGRRLTKLSGGPVAGGVVSSRRASGASSGMGADDFTDDDASQHSGPPSPTPMADHGVGGGRKSRSTKKRRR